MKTKGKTKTLKKTALWTATAILLILGVMLIIVSSALSRIDRGDGSFNDTDLGVYEGLPGNVKNIAVFGVDSREGDVSGRSDAIMILSVDMKNHKIKAVSLMRDSLVNIEGYGKKKINSAYAIGGVELAIKTINQNFNMNITDYISVNFTQLAGVVDALGGVEVEITEAERRNANKYIKEMAELEGIEADLIKESGTVTLYGYQAVAYTRIRYVGNADFQRTERQREVMGKLMDKALSASFIKYPSIVNELLPMVETSLSNKEILRIAFKVLIFGKPDFEQGRFPIDGTYTTNENYAMKYNMEKAADKLYSFIYDDEPFYEFAGE